MARMTLTEATMLALQGKLELEESKEVKNENIDVSITDDNMTVVDTDEGTVIVQTPADDLENADTPDEVVEVPVEGEETIIPEDEVSEETVEDIVDEEPTEELPTMDEIVDGDTEEDLEESKKVQENVEIEVSDDGKEVEVTTNEGEEVEVKDETPENNEETVETPEEVEDEVIEESKEVKTESSDATNEFIKDLAEILKKHSRADIENMELSEDGNIVTVTFKGGATKKVNIEADSITAAIRDITKVVESKEVKTEEAQDITSDMTDEEIVKYIANNFEKITGIDVDTIFNPEAEQKENGVFNQAVIDKAGDTLMPILDKAGITGTRLETILEKLDDELALLQESKEVKTEAAGELSAKLYDYFDEMGYMDGAQGEIINAFISWLSEDEIKRFAEIYEYPIFDEEDDLEESKKVCTKCGKEECICEKKEEVKKIEKYNKQSFNEALTRYFKRHNKVVESFKTTKLLKNEKSIKIEGIISNTEGTTKNVSLKLDKVQEDNNFTRYIVSESNGILKESVEKLDKINMVTKINNGVFECRYMINRVNKK